MAANTDVTITNNSNSKQMLFRAVSNYTESEAQPVLNVPLVNTGATNNFNFRFTGKSRQISFDYVLFNDGTDVSNGTDTAPGVIEVFEQITFLDTSIFTPDFDHTVTVQNNATAGMASRTGVIIANDVDQSNPNFITGRMTIQEGTSFGGL